MPVEVENQPRNVAQMKDFGSRLNDFAEIEEPVMDLENLEAIDSKNRQNFLRQSDPNEGNNGENLDDDAVRCIPKVMQVS